MNADFIMPLWQLKSIGIQLTYFDFWLQAYSSNVPWVWFCVAWEWSQSQLLLWRENVYMGTNRFTSKVVIITHLQGEPMQAISLIEQGPVKIKSFLPAKSSLHIIRNGSLALKVPHLFWVRTLFCALIPVIYYQWDTEDNEIKLPCRLISLCRWLFCASILL